MKRVIMSALSGGAEETTGGGVAVWDPRGKFDLSGSEHFQQFWLNLS